MSTKWMNKEGKHARVAEEDIAQRLAEGYVMGRAYRVQSLRERISRKVPHMTNRKLLVRYGISLEDQRRAREEGKKWCGFHKQYEDASLFHQRTKECKKGRREADLARYAKYGRDRKYKMEKDWRPRVFRAQGGHCGLCPAVQSGRGRRLSIDHDHDCCPKDGTCCGKCVRGLLCDSCNPKLWYLEDLLMKGTKIEDPSEWTKAAIRYLIQYGKKLPLDTPLPL